MNANSIFQIRTPTKNRYNSDRPASQSYFTRHFEPQPTTHHSHRENSLAYHSKSHSLAHRQARVKSQDNIVYSDTQRTYSPASPHRKLKGADEGEKDEEKVKKEILIRQSLRRINKKRKSAYSGKLQQQSKESSCVEREKPVLLEIIGDLEGKKCKLNSQLQQIRGTSHESRSLERKNAKNGKVEHKKPSKEKQKSAQRIADEQVMEDIQALGMAKDENKEEKKEISSNFNNAIIQMPANFEQPHYHNFHKIAASIPNKKFIIFKQNEQAKDNPSQEMKELLLIDNMTNFIRAKKKSRCHHPPPPKFMQHSQEESQVKEKAKTDDRIEQFKNKMQRVYGERNRGVEIIGKSKSSRQKQKEKNKVNNNQKDEIKGWEKSPMLYHDEDDEMIP